MITSYYTITVREAFSVQNEPPGGGATLSVLLRRMLEDGMEMVSGRLNGHRSSKALTRELSPRCHGRVKGVIFFCAGGSGGQGRIVFGKIGRSEDR